MKHFIYFFLFVVPFFAKAQSEPIDTSSIKWKTFKKDLYFIEFPETWTIDTSHLMGTDVFFFSPKDSASDKFRENVNVFLQDITGMGITLDQFVENSEKQIKILVTNGNLIESKRMSRNGKEFHKLVYSGTQGIFDLRTVQYYFFVGEKVFMVTFVSEAGEYKKYEKVGEKIMDSFRLVE